MTDQVVEENQDQPEPGRSLPQTQEQPGQERPIPLSNPPSSGSLVETPEDRAKREKELDEQRKREELRRSFPPSYRVLDHLPVRTIGKLKRR